MRYIKKFESQKLKEERLKYFCENHLSYLIDDGFVISVIWQGHGYNGPSKDCYNINLCKIDNGSAKRFTWDEVKDSYIPFLLLLNKNYKISTDLIVIPGISLYNGRQNYFVSIEHILSEKNLPDRYDNVSLLEITFQVS